MSNHYHLLVQVELDCLASAMKALNSSYAQYFNKRHGRIGYLFQGRFKSEPINDDAYFLTALRYIHKNPQKAGICRADEYRWSSYQEYIGRNAVAGMAAIAKTDLGLSMLGGIEAFREFHATAGDSKSCLDLETGRRIVTDDDAMAIARAALPGTQIESISSLSKAERDEALRTLRSARLSVRQIERLTGVSKSVVAKA